MTPKDNMDLNLPLQVLLQGKWDRLEGHHYYLPWGRWGRDVVVYSSDRPRGGYVNIPKFVRYLVLLPGRRRFPSSDFGV